MVFKFQSLILNSIGATKWVQANANRRLPTWLFLKFVLTATWNFSNITRAVQTLGYPPNSIRVKAKIYRTSIKWMNKNFFLEILSQKNS